MLQQGPQGHKFEALQSQKMARRKAGSVQQSRRGNCDPKPRVRKFFFPQEKTGKSTLTNGTQKLGTRRAEIGPQDLVTSILSES